MVKMKNSIKGFISLLIVTVGAYLLTYFFTNEYSFRSIVSGILAFAILYPAMSQWELFLWGVKEDEKV